MNRSLAYGGADGSAATVKAGRGPPGGSPEPALAAPAPKTAVERLLTHELGGEIVAEHALDPGETPEDAEDLAALNDDIETDDPDHTDPGLFDTDGED